MVRPIFALLLLAPLLATQAEAGDGRQAGRPDAPPASSSSSFPQKNPAAVWLGRFSRGMAELSYHGVLTYESGDHLESLRVTHGRVGGETYERLEHLDGDHREVIRRGEQLTCIYLGQRLSRLFRQPKGGHNGNLTGLEAHYDVRLEGESRVAGRRSMGVRIKPRDEYRFGYRLPLDYDTGLLLRSELLTADGRILERFQFVEVTIGPLKPEWVSNEPVVRNAVPASAPAIAAAPPGWTPHWLPAGFALSNMPRATPEDVQTYSDGLAVMSVFVEPAEEPLPTAEGRAQQGATVAYTKPLRRQDKSYIVTVMGEVPQATAAGVANSVDWSSRP